MTSSDGTPASSGERAGDERFADAPVNTSARAWPARAKVAMQKLTGPPDERSALAPGQTDSDPVPDAPARRLRATSVSTKAADVFAGIANRLLSDDFADAEHVSGTLGGALESGDDVVVQAPERAATRRSSGEVVTASPVLTLPRVKQPEAIAVYVHGGAVEASHRTHPADPAFVRMVPFARDVERRSHGRIGGALLRLAVRGWNDPEKPAVEDTRWALGELRRRYPGVPLAVVGHSMGGRVVLDIAASEELDAVVALAPWAADTYDAESFTGVPLLGIHGRHDTVTDPQATKDLISAVQDAGGDARFISMPGWHAMLWNPVRWHRETSTFLIDTMLAPRHS